MQINMLEANEYGTGKQRESSGGETVSPSFAMKADSFVADFQLSQKQSSGSSGGHAFETS